MTGEARRCGTFAPVLAAMLLLAPLARAAVPAEPAIPVLADHRITEGIELDLDHPIGYVFEADAERALITLRGTLQIGVAGELARTLDAHPWVTGLVLDSDGGNVYQARALASLVLTHALDTHVARRCHSACAIVYAAGARRTLAAGASIGFHCYRLDAGVVARPGIDIAAEQEKDRAFLGERIADADFTAKLFRCDSPGLWLPAPAELVEAGVVHEIVDD